ncbi:MAG: DUF1552 domain-containing protein [Bryobacteraceae bacterium]|nr:DUF1552 domain-containing protein [Bryobacteraceae bacterium]
MPTSRPDLAGRRFFLRAAGVRLALPILDSLGINLLGSGLAVTALSAQAKTVRPMRMAAIGNAFGFYPDQFFPKQTGAGFDTPHLLEPLAPYRKDISVFSGLDHGVKGGHFAVHSFLSGVRQVDAKGMPDGNISVDQRAAETVGGATRFPSLTLGSEEGLHGGCMMCWTRSGTRVNPIQGPRELFRRLFVSESKADHARAKDRLELQGSILDAVNGDARSLKNHLGHSDQQKLDEYFTSVREVEKVLELRRKWADVPKPAAPLDEPENRGLVNDIPVLYDLIALALQTDSTRIATLEIAGGFEASVLGVRKEYHALSHHGQVPESIDLLVKLERYQTEQFARFLGKLKSIEDGDGTLLDHTMVLFGSGMGNGNAHTNLNLPVVLAGGGFKHGAYHAFPTTGLNKQPLSNLFLTMLQRFGIEQQKFALSTGTLRGI